VTLEPITKGKTKEDKELQEWEVDDLLQQAVDFVQGGIIILSVVPSC
jgi:hypothetical protein